MSKMQGNEDLRQFVSMRIEMMELYEKMASHGTEALEATATGTKHLADPDKNDGGLKDMLDSMMIPFDSLVLIIDRLKEYDFLDF